MALPVSTNGAPGLMVERGLGLLGDLVIRLGACRDGRRVLCRTALLASMATTGG